MKDNAEEVVKYNSKYPETEERLFYFISLIGLYVKQTPGTFELNNLLEEFMFNYWKAIFNQNKKVTDRVQIDFKNMSNSQIIMYISRFIKLIDIEF